MDLLFAPGVEEMYPEGFATRVQVEGPLTALWEGAVRPGHFQGVATVVARLFLLVQPQRAYFGEKDYQQLLVVRRMVRDLGFPVEVVGVPTVREEDGLALSSRNVYLSPETRKKAPVLYRALLAMREVAGQGEAWPRRSGRERRLCGRCPSSARTTSPSSTPRPSCPSPTGSRGPGGSWPGGSPRRGL